MFSIYKLVFLVFNSRGLNTFYFFGLFLDFKDVVFLVCWTRTPLNKS